MFITTHEALIWPIQFSQKILNMRKSEVSTPTVKSNEFLKSNSGLIKPQLY